MFIFVHPLELSAEGLVSQREEVKYYEFIYAQPDSAQVLTLLSDRVSSQCLVAGSG